MTAYENGTEMMEDDVKDDGLEIVNFHEGKNIIQFSKEIFKTNESNSTPIAHAALQGFTIYSAPKMVHK